MSIYEAGYARGSDAREPLLVPDESGREGSDSPSASRIFIFNLDGVVRHNTTWASN